MEESRGIAAVEGKTEARASKLCKCISGSLGPGNAKYFGCGHWARTNFIGPSTATYTTTFGLSVTRGYKYTFEEIFWFYSNRYFFTEPSTRFDFDLAANGVSEVADVHREDYLRYF